MDLDVASDEDDGAQDAREGYPYGEAVSVGDARRKIVAHAGWPEGFIERTAGAWQGEPPVRPDQGDYDERERHE